MPQPEHRYALCEGEKQIGVGTRAELAKYFGVSKEYIRSLSRPSRMKRIERLKDKCKESVSEPFRLPLKTLMARAELIETGRDI
jgi:hypothetical protein